ncbi:MAG: hypothetical protein PHI29_12775 [Gallionella sp.]|nr:hypothetical protein [Gallionella sp.]
MQIIPQVSDKELEQFVRSELIELIASAEMVGSPLSVNQIFPRAMSSILVARQLLENAGDDWTDRVVELIGQAIFSQKTVIPRQLADEEIYACAKKSANQIAKNANRKGCYLNDVENFVGEVQEQVLKSSRNVRAANNWKGYVYSIARNIFKRLTSPFLFLRTVPK